MTITRHGPCQLMRDGVWTGRLSRAAFLPRCFTSTYCPEGKGCMWWCCSSSGSACQILTGPPRSSQTVASLLFHSLQLQNVHKPQFIQHRVGPGTSALTSRNRNNVCSRTKNCFSYNKVFYFTCRGAETLTKGPVFGVSVAPAGSLYCSDWLMYSDQPESTVLAGEKKGFNWW